MRTGKITTALAVLLILGAIALWGTTEAVAHCDTLDGPVVTTAKTALEKGNVTPVLKWVKPEREEEIRAAFQRTLAVRVEGPEAKELADTAFFETLVRIHRAGEGAPYNGLLPAGSAVEPGIAAADKAVETGRVDALAKEVAKTIDAGIRSRFAQVAETGKHMDESIAAGREYVEAYVTFIHHVEAVHTAAQGGPGHEPGAEHTDKAHHEEGATPPEHVH